MVRSQLWKRFATVAALLISTNRKTEAASNLFNVPTSKISPDLRQMPWATGLRWVIVRSAIVGRA